MEEWAGFELSEQVLNEATAWIAALDDIDNAVMQSASEEGGYNLLALQQSDSKVQNALIDQFNEWLNAHVQHQQAYAEMSLLWAKSVCIHEISDRISASNVFSFNQNQANNIQTDFAQRAQEFKRKHIPILLPHNHEAQGNNECAQKSSPAWVFVASLCLIGLGLCSPIIQQLL